MKHFVDYKTVVARGGKGGNGCMSFTRFKGKEFAGPDGGNGGNGGHVILEGKGDKQTLKTYMSGAVSRGVLSWTCDLVLALGQRFNSHSWRLFCFNPLE